MEIVQAWQRKWRGGQVQILSFVNVDFKIFSKIDPHLPAPLKRGDNGGIIDPFSISLPTKIGWKINYYATIESILLRTSLDFKFFVSETYRMYVVLEV